MSKLTPFLWFDGGADEAAQFYTSIFKNSRVLERRPGGPVAGGIMSVTLELEGQRLILFNGGPHYKLNPAFSLLVSVETQREVDELWDKLLAGGREDRCGWLQDKYGVSWQIIPTALGRMLGDKDPARARRAMEAMLQMKKIDLAALQAAYDGAEAWR